MARYQTSPTYAGSVRKTTVDRFMVYISHARVTVTLLEKSSSMLTVTPDYYGKLQKYTVALAKVSWYTLPSGRDSLWYDRVDRLELYTSHVRATVKLLEESTTMLIVTPDYYGKLQKYTVALAKVSWYTLPSGRDSLWYDRVDRLELYTSHVRATVKLLEESTTMLIVTPDYYGKLQKYTVALAKVSWYTP